MTKSESTKVLVVEDEQLVRTFIRANLIKNGYEVHEVSTGEDAVDAFLSVRPLVVILDIMLPGMDGFEVCRRIRATGKDAVIVMLTSRAEDVDKIKGLELGADDYMVKPFNPMELVARIRTILRRWARPETSGDVVEFMGLRLEFRNQKCYKGGQEVDLTPREFALLSLFLQSPGQLITRETLFRSLWGENHFGSMKGLDVYVRRLREKIEADPSEPDIIKTVWGQGYICG